MGSKKDLENRPITEELLVAWGLGFRKKTPELIPVPEREGYVEFKTYLRHSPDGIHSPEVCEHPPFCEAWMLGKSSVELCSTLEASINLALAKIPQEEYQRRLQEIADAEEENRRRLAKPVHAIEWLIPPHEAIGKVFPNGNGEIFCLPHAEEAKSAPLVNNMMLDVRFDRLLMKDVPLTWKDLMCPMCNQNQLPQAGDRDLLTIPTVLGNLRFALMNNKVGRALGGD